MKGFVRLRAKTYGYLTNDNNISKKVKGTKKYDFLQASHLNNDKIDKKSLLDIHKELRTNNKIILKSQQRFKSDRHFFTEEINKIALSSNDDKSTVN